jgi:cation transport protein ChaC
MDDFWVFGYGSLMWEPGFSYAEVRHARLFGWHRRLCLLSVRNRGTEDRPGLVLAVDRGGSCHGLAFRVDAEHVEETRAYLWERELSTDAYRPLRARVRLDNGERVTALTFVARPGHRQYLRAESPERAAELVCQGQGQLGTSLDYLRNVVRHLDEIGIADGPMHQVLAIAETMAGRRRGAGRDEFLAGKRD